MVCWPLTVIRLAASHLPGCKPHCSVLASPESYGVAFAARRHKLFGSAETSEGSTFFDLSKIYKVLNLSTNWNHSAHYVEVLRRSRLLPGSSSEHKTRWESEIKKQEKGNRASAVITVKLCRKEAQNLCAAINISLNDTCSVLTSTRHAIWETRIHPHNICCTAAAIPHTWGIGSKYLHLKIIKYLSSSN